MSNHRTQRLRVAAPTLEPDPVFLGVLAELGASSQPVAPRTARSAGLRMIVATASVAVIAAATWAAEIPHGGDIPLSPADSPAQQEPSGPPSHGNVGTPQPDVSTTPGSPLSPGLPGTTSDTDGTGRGVDRAAEQARKSGDLPGARKGADKGRKTGWEKHGNGGPPGLTGTPGHGPGKGPRAGDRGRDAGPRGTTGHRDRDAGPRGKKKGPQHRNPRGHGAGNGHGR
ncbi:hypothetical protein L615_000500001030 [Nocardioides sp. J9]|nr:hypothetical protein L615_000500001030 [Nocardioides sp. J9]